MEKETYIAPEVNVVTMDCVSIIAASNKLTENLDGTISGNLGGGSVTEGNPYEEAHSATRIYFDAWDESEESGDYWGN